MKHTVIRQNFVRCGLTGCFLEIFWTGLGSLLHANRTCMGKTSILMFPIYGMAAFFAPVMNLIKNIPLFFRGCIYTIGIFSAEYLSGSFLRRFRMCPWDYSHSRFNVKGLIRFDYAPAWFFTGLLFEHILKKTEQY